MEIKLPTFPENQRVVFFFEGGPKDGESEVSDSSGYDKELNAAQHYWIMTGGGEIGHRFGGISPGYMRSLQTHAKFNSDGTVSGIGPAQMHLYEVDQRIESYDEIKVTCKYNGIAGDSVGASDLRPY